MKRITWKNNLGPPKDRRQRNFRVENRAKK